MAVSGIPSWARVGAKVMCVDGATDPHGNAVVAGETYTISRTDSDGVTGYVSLVEDRDQDCGWYVSRFRPLITLEHDMAVHFERLLDVPEGVDA